MNAAPEWTKDPPTEPGLYWYSLRTDDRPGAAVLGVLRHCRIVVYEGKLMDEQGQGPASQRQTVAAYQRWWAGPLPEPEETHGRRRRR